MPIPKIILFKNELQTFFLNIWEPGLDFNEFGQSSQVLEAKDEKFL